MQPSLEWPFSDGSLAYVRRPTRSDLGHVKISRVVIALQALRERPSAAALHAVENDISGGLNNKALEIWRVKPGLLVCASRLSSVWQGAAGQNLQTITRSFFLVCLLMC